MKLLLPTLLLLWLIQANSLRESYSHCIVGAGPGGLQLGHYMNAAGRDYVIFERAATAGSFFDVFPRHRKLISLNKRFTGRTNKEFNLRHDWNSLLDHPELPPMTTRSEERWPPADVLAQYLREFAEDQKENIKYNTSVDRMAKTASGNFELTVRTKGELRQVRCQVAVVATGLELPNKPSSVLGIELAVGYEELPIDGRSFEEKSVLVLGTGNAGLETADALAPYVNYVHVVNPRFTPVTPSWETRYVGSPRAINIGVLDAYLLKSLDGGIGNPFSSRRLSLHKCTYTSSITLATLEDEGRRFHDLGGRLFHNDANIVETGEGSRTERICVLPCNEEDVVSFVVTEPAINSTQGVSLINDLGAKMQLKAVKGYIDAQVFRSPKKSDAVQSMHAVITTQYELQIARSNITEENIDRLVEMAASNGSPHPMVYDTVVRCLGWKQNLSMYTDSCQPQMRPDNKYASMNSQYESVNVKNLFFAGTLSHGKDFRRSAGGFIHGFRYTARALFRILEERFEQQAWPAISEPACTQDAVARVADWMLHRINTASGPYQMVGFLGDGVVLHSNGSMSCLEELPAEYFHTRFKNHSRLFWHFGYYGQMQPLHKSITQGTKFEIHLWHSTASGFARELFRMKETFQTDWLTVRTQTSLKLFISSKAAAAAKQNCEPMVLDDGRTWHTSLSRNQNRKCTDNKICSIQANPKISKAEWVASEVDLWVSNKSPASIDLMTPDGGKVSLDPGTHKVFKTYHGDQWAASLDGKRPTLSYAVDFENGKVQEFVAS